MKRRTIREAIIEVLKRNGKPLSARDIYSLIIEQDLYRFNAINPENIVRSEIRRHCEGLEFPSANEKKYFQITKEGKYWIFSSTVSKINIDKRIPQTDLKVIVEELNETHIRHTKVFKEYLLQQLKELDPYNFEMFSKKLLECYGFSEVHVTRKSRDGGIDGYGILKMGLTNLNVAFQCKRWKGNKVGRKEVSQLMGDIYGKYEQGIIFTTSSFTPEALGIKTDRKAYPIILLDGVELVNIMIEKRFGIVTESMPVYVSALDQIFNEE